MRTEPAFPPAVFGLMTHRPFALALVLLSACGAAAPTARPRSPDQVVAMEEMRIVATREGSEFVFDSYDAGQLFERGTALLSEGQCRRAVEEFYDRIAAEFPTSRYLGPALYNAGLCLQEGGELEAAVPYYRRVIEVVPASRDGKHAALQLVSVLIGLERWEEARELSDRILLREDLSSAERLEGLARRAQALLGLERWADAERQARDALSYFRTRQGDEAIADPYFAAAANFVLAETMRLRSEGMELPAADVATQHEVLEAHARLILDAQREYFSTIRFTDAHWAAAAGYRIGAMYDRLWHALMEAPVPPPTREMNEATRAIYEEEYRAELARHVRPLIRHAIRYWELTLLMIERTGVRTEWAERTQRDLERMRALLLQESREEAGSGEADRPEPTSMIRIPPELRSSSSTRLSRAFAAIRGSRRGAPSRTRLAVASAGGMPEICAARP